MKKPELNFKRESSIFAFCMSLALAYLFYYYWKFPLMVCLGFGLGGPALFIGAFIFIDSGKIKDSLSTGKNFTFNPIKIEVVINGDILFIEGVIDDVCRVSIDTLEIRPAGPAGISNKYKADITTISYIEDTRQDELKEAALKYLKGKKHE